MHSTDKISGQVPNIMTPIQNITTTFIKLGQEVKQKEPQITTEPQKGHIITKFYPNHCCIMTSLQ